MGVGGAFDFMSGRIRRAPKIIQKIGFEWLWRLILEPRRLPRILQAVFVFPLLILMDKFK
jgi:N-acetylglucosaminyldiphosphoundecaprenol N-acetyl-beta-D-mannosaminyltransferase